MVPRVHPFQYSRDRTRRAFQGNCSCQLTLSSEVAVAARNGSQAASHNRSCQRGRFSKCAILQSATSRSAPAKLLSILRCINQNRCLFLVGCWSSDVIAIELRRPEGCAGPSPRRDFANNLVVVSVLLLIDIRETSRQVPSSRDVHPLSERVKVDAVHTPSRGEMSDFLTRLGVHGNHFRGSMGS